MLSIVKTVIIDSHKLISKERGLLACFQFNDSSLMNKIIGVMKDE